MTASLAPGHLAATPVGMTVRDEVEKIAEGRQQRFIVGNLARFLERAMQKGNLTG